MTNTEKKRGILLTIWLIQMLVVNSGAALFYFSGEKFVTSVIPAMPTWAIYAFGIFSLLNFIFTIYLLQWKKWAFFAFCGSAGIIFIINILLNSGIIAASLGLLVPVILYLLLKSKWNLLE